MSKYDIISIGSGLGGLECGAILSKEGYHVCVLEKNEDDRVDSGGIEAAFQ